VVEIIARFRGEVAERHLLPAFEGSQSIEGLSRAIALIAHYSTTGEVRKRYPFNEHARLYLEPPRPGSFDALFSLMTDPSSVLLTTPIGAFGVAIAASLTIELLKLLTHRAVGGDYTPDERDVANLVRSRSGDIEALGEAIEPALKKSSHSYEQWCGKRDADYWRQQYCESKRTYKGVHVLY
jgi:hypothetical protein